MSEGTSNEERIKEGEAELEALKKARAEALAGNAPDLEQEEAAAVMADKDSTPDDKTWAKRYSDTKSAWYKERNDKDAAIEDLKAQLTKANEGSQALPTTVEDLKAWQVEHPQVAGAIKAMATEIAKDMTGGLEDKVNKLSEKEQTSTMALTRTKVLAKHPDLDTINKDKAFHGWVKEQSSWVDKAVYSGTDPKPIIQALDLYKLENNLLEKSDEEPSAKAGNNQDEVDAASLVVTSKVEKPPSETSTKLLESEVLNWTDKDWEDNKPRYDQARRAGTLVLDVTYG